MLSTLDTKNDPHDTVEIAPDVVLVARAAADFPSLAPNAADRPLDRQPNMGSGTSAAAAPKVDATFRATDVNDIARGRPSRGGRWLRSASMAFLFALVSAVGAALWEHYGDEAQAMIASYSPKIIEVVPTLTSWLPWQRPASAAQTDAPAQQQAAVADASVPAAAQPADNAAPATAAPPQTPAQESAQLLQSMSHDVATLTQQIEALKDSIAELKAGQEQLSRDMANRLAEAKAAETIQRPRAAPPRPVVAAVHRPKPVYAPAPYIPPPPPPVQIAPAPTQATADPDADTVVLRPPMPVR